MHEKDQFPDRDTVDKELRKVVLEGIYYVEDLDVQHLARFRILGGCPNEPANLGSLRTNLIYFIRSGDNSLIPEVRSMALRLLGATGETRNKELPARQEATGQVTVKGQTVREDAVRRKPRGRQEKVLAWLTDALIHIEKQALLMPGWEAFQADEGLHPITLSSIIHLDPDNSQIFVNHYKITFLVKQSGSFIYFHSGWLTDAGHADTKVDCDHDEHLVYGGLAQRPDRPEGYLDHIFFFGGLHGGQSYELKFREHFAAPTTSPSFVLAAHALEDITLGLVPHGHPVSAVAVAEFESEEYKRAWALEWDGSQYKLTHKPQPEGIYVLGWILEK